MYRTFKTFFIIFVKNVFYYVLFNIILANSSERRFFNMLASVDFLIIMSSFSQIDIDN